MQALRSFFSRSASKTSAPQPAAVAGKPVELSLAQQQLVAGGLPRVGSPALVVEPPLPRVG